MNRVEKIFTPFGKPFVMLAQQIPLLGAFFLFHLRLIPKYFSKPVRIKQILIQIESIGANSLGVVILTGVFTGLVLAIQLYYAFNKFGAEAMMGYTIFLAIGKELGPVFTTLMVISRAISAMSAELGTMRVTEQIDAIDVLSVDSTKYLIIPRIIATVVSLPMLILVFDFVANLSAYFLATQALGVNPTAYLDTIRQLAEVGDFAEGIVKGAVFGILISWIGTYVGYFTSGGARGVGQSTTKAVVISSVTLFLANYFISSLFLA